MLSSRTPKQHCGNSRSRLRRPSLSSGDSSPWPTTTFSMATTKSKRGSRAPSFRTKRRRTHQAGRRRARLLPRLQAEERLWTCPRRSRSCGPAMCAPSTTRTLPPPPPA
ncbi:uncharacterized protein ACA1_008410 [Acanthamoeba castellanii str. Neff]|uniref:Uncharacterized protein n=1 Tax=Acanthamoeba castellanii (strain ATCC 30010 / Neff) TaxID=1257118 RepID=L8GDQ3_ACACF|nr:uncharacterized protein ACA1_008410 [Acanthamoeba castellanii str. Neff]ELR10989.1 hypothetical protein ACA1_008410 [Acanthamoeba castellanii str. Neff]